MRLSTSSPLTLSRPPPMSYLKEHLMSLSDSEPEEEDQSPSCSAPPEAQCASRSTSSSGQGASRSTLSLNQSALRSPSPEDDYIERMWKRDSSQIKYGKASQPKSMRREIAKTNGRDEDDVDVNTGVSVRKDSMQSHTQLGAEDDRVSDREIDDELSATARRLVLERRKHQNGETNDIHAATARQHLDRVSSNADVEGETGDPLFGHEIAVPENSHTFVRQHPHPVDKEVNTEEDDFREGGKITKIIGEDGKEFTVRRAQKPTEKYSVAKDTFNEPEVLRKWRKSHHEKWDVIAILNEDVGWVRYKVKWDCIDPKTEKLWVSWEPKKYIHRVYVDEWLGNPERDGLMARYEAGEKKEWKAEQALKKKEAARKKEGAALKKKEAARKKAEKALLTKAKKAEKARLAEARRSGTATRGRGGTEITRITPRMSAPP